MPDTAPQHAKVVATLGPASADVDTIKRMAEAGMDVARINTSHTAEGSLEELIEAVQEAREEVDAPLAVMVDLQGPEIRTGAVDGAVTLDEDDTVTFVEENTVDGSRIGVTMPLTNVKKGDRILLDDGQIETEVTAVTGNAVEARVVVGGVLESRAGVNIPGVSLDAAIPTEKDRTDMETAAAYDVDFIGASFVRDADDIYNILAVLEDLETDARIVAKIEQAEAVDNLDAIVEASYGVMVARGDLGVELPLEEVPTVQKRIIRTCREHGAPVITATEMLESMIHRRRPTRAEASDVANAVLDGTDAVMLSAETAVGDHPVRVVRMMDTIVGAVENSEEYREMQEQRVPRANNETAESLARSARFLAQDVGAAAIVVESESGYTARKAAKFRPDVPIITTTPNADVARKLALSWGVQVQHTALEGDDTDAVVNAAVDAAIDTGIVDRGDTVIVLSGMFRELKDVRTTNMLKIHVTAERLGAGKSVVDGHGVGTTARVDGEELPEDAVALIPAGADVDLSHAADRLNGIIQEDTGLTTEVARFAREHGVPMVCGVDLAPFGEGETVTVDGERGVVYAGNVSHHALQRDRP